MQTIYLDTANKGIVPTIYAKQGDIGRKVLVVLTDAGVPYSPPAGSVFSVWYEGDSGEGNYTDIGDKSAFSVNGNKVTVELIAQMLAVAGEGLLCLVLNGADGSQIASWNIKYTVEQIPGANSEPARSYYTAFSKAVENLPYPDASLSAPGKAADAGAVGNRFANLKAADVGARPDTWLPTPAEIGALSGTDTTLAVSGKAADAGAVGTALAGKAPAGYGLGQIGGELVDVADFSQLDGIIRNGWYFIRFAQPFYIDGVFTQFFTLEVCGETGEHIHQTIHVLGSNYKLHRNCDMGVWGTVEWENPPMVPGVEYRTVERYNGKVVYAKAFNTGELTNGGSFDFVNENVTTVRAAAVCNGHLLPYYGGGDLVGGTWSIWYDITGKQFMGFMGSGMSANSYTVQAWYTKD